MARSNFTHQYLKPLYGKVKFYTPIQVLTLWQGQILHTNFMARSNFTHQLYGKVKFYTPTLWQGQILHTYSGRHFMARSHSHSQIRLPKVLGKKASLAILAAL